MTPSSFAVWAAQFVLLINTAASFSTKSTSSSASRNSANHPTIVREDDPTTAPIAIQLPQIPKIPASEFDPNIQYYRTIKSGTGNCLVYETPVIVEGVLSEEACEKLTDDLVAKCGSIEVTLQQKQRQARNPIPAEAKSTKKSKRERRRKHSKKDSSASKKNKDATTTTDLYLCSFMEAIDLVLGQSKHDNALLAFCEGLLNPQQLKADESSLPQKKHSSSQLSLQQTIEDVREQLFQQRSHTNHEIDNSGSGSSSKDHKNTNATHPVDPCWFREYFPKGASPTDCVILAGEGATSTLHRDPLEWTGTNICLDGTKVWRFVAPPLAAAAIAATAKTAADQEIFLDDALGGEQCSSVAVIDGMLDAYRLDSIAWGDRDDDPLTLSAGWQSDYSLFANFCDGISSSALSELEEEHGTRAKIDTITGIASDIDRLQPDIPVGIVGASVSESSMYSSEDCITIWSGVQKPGDMIVIPAHWWHQTYAMEASLAIASQRCGAKRDSERVFRHILETTATTAATLGLATEPDPNEILSLFRSSSSGPQTTVDRLFDYLATLREERRNSERE